MLRNSTGELALSDRCWTNVTWPTKRAGQEQNIFVNHDSKAGNGVGPEPSQVPDTTVQAAAGGYGIAIRRTGQAVQITLTPNDEYASIELYDRLVHSIGEGSLRLELKFPRP